MILVTGGSASGKSAFAEKLAGECPTEQKLYIATMQPYDRECEERIGKHRKMREGTGFETVECYGLSLSEAYERDSVGETVLFECMSNYVSNVMFGSAGSGEEESDAEELADSMVSELLKLNEKTEELIIVTNEIFSDGTVYDELTRKYLKVLGLCNQKLAKHAGRVYEVVCGIPLQIQGNRYEQS